MSKNALEARGKALEDEFFYKDDQRKLHAMRDSLDEKQAREELRRASGMTDDVVLSHLLALGIKANTIAALSLVPLIAVAWADGEVQEHERASILFGAHGRGLDKGTDGYALLESWLAHRPDDSLLEAWIEYIHAIREHMTPEHIEQLKSQVLGFAKMIAGADGGFLGIGKVSHSEAVILKRIEAAFAS